MLRRTSPVPRSAEAAARIPPLLRGTVGVAAANGRQVCLGFLWDPASWEIVPSLWDFLFEWLGERRVHWNLPALPGQTSVRKKASIARTLRSRIESRGDGVTALGYSGSPHSLLSLDELDRELSWGLKNPWGTGIVDLLGFRPAILIPRVVDLARPGAWNLYGEHGFRLVGVFPEAWDRLPQAPVGCLSFLRVRVSSCTPKSPEARCVRRLLGSSSDVRLQLDLSGISDAAALQSLLEDPPGIFGGRLPLLSPLPEPAAELPPKPAAALRRLDWSPLSVPGLHSVLDETAGMSRKKRKKNEEYDALLNRLGSTADGTARADSESRDPHRQLRLVAHMLGEVSLTGSHFDVRIRGGRFCGVTRQGKDLMPLHPALSFIRMGKSLWSFKTLSSFSFESERGTGLREELGLDGKDGALIRIEYAFREDSPLLSINLEVRFPDLPAGAQVDEYAPIEIALRTLKKGEPAAIEVSAPDGSSSSVEVSEKSGTVFAPGAWHRIRRPDGGWIVLQFSSAGHTWGLPSFRVARARGGRILEMNPFGSYLPAPGSLLSGRCARFSLSLGLEDA